MPFENLTKLLRSLGEEDVTIRRAVVLKFGCLRVAKATLSERSAYPITDLEKLRKTLDGIMPRRASKEMFDSLSEHPNIFDAVPVESEDNDEEDDELLTYGDEAGMLVKGPMYSFRLHLPKTRQVYQDMDCEEHFSVVKCPMHPDIIVIFATKVVAPGTTNHAPPEGAQRTYVHADDVFIVSESSAEDFDVILDVFWELGYTVRRFYETMMFRDTLIDYSTEIGSHFSDISEAVSKMTQVPVWNLVKAHNLSKTAKVSLAKIHTKLVEFGQQAAIFSRDRNKLVATLKRNPMLSKMTAYFMEMADPPAEVPPALTTALAFFEGELQRYGNVRSLLLASLMGAMVGSIFTGVLSLLVQHYSRMPK